VTDSSKFSKDALIKVCGLDQVDFVVTEGEPPIPFKKACIENDTRLLISN
jgi:DeoR/GlpR family transcriptional regulator of sugar metabolism